jgi:octaprenyl-diphosphate synthase
MANSAISCLADSNSKAALLQLAAFAVDRSF